LAAGTGGADKIELNFAFVDSYRGCNLNHGLSITV
jgi:hypothetical protein